VLFTYFTLPYRGQIIFFDEMLLRLLGQSRRAWGQKGLRLPHKKQMSYKWIYLALWLDLLTHEIGWTWMANMKAQSLLEVMQNWPRPFGGVIWDRAPSHRARMLKQLPIDRIELPPYSSDINPVERIFEEVRRNVEGKRYRSLDEKRGR
jgi:hypothetical protein